VVAEGRSPARLRCPGLHDRLDQGGTTIATFLLGRAWPKKYVAAELHAGFDDEVAVEKITIAHAGLERVAVQVDVPGGE
jgi:hypothetical protein